MRFFFFAFGMLVAYIAIDGALGLPIFPTGGFGINLPQKDPVSLINGAQEKNLIPLFMSMFIPNYIQNLAVGITNLLAAPDRREKRSADKSWSDYFYRANCAALKENNTTG